MKKIILAVALALGFAIAASAQPRALGVRSGNGGEVSYQHSLGSNFLEVDGGLVLGLNNVFNVGAKGFYNFMISEFGNGFGFYAGPGASIGLGVGKESYLTIAAAGMVGIEYNFNFPLQISLDIRPQLGLVNEAFGFWGWYPHLGLRYAF